MREPIPLPVEPVAVVGVWDANAKGDPYDAHFEEACQWAAEHMAPWHHETFRAEFCYLDGVPAVIVHMYHLDEDGRRHWAPGGAEVARLPPAALALDELPPGRLLRVEEVPGDAGDMPRAGLPDPV